MNYTVTHSLPNSQFVRCRIAQDEIADMRCHTEAEARALTMQRGRDINAGRSKLISHNEVMHEMEQMLATYEA